MRPRPGAGDGDSREVHDSGGPETPRASSRRPLPRTGLAGGAAAAAVVLLVTGWLAVTSLTIESGSMMGTLRPGDRILVSRLSYRLHAFRRGDIIAFRYPQEEARIFIKRVIALPGDVVEETHGRFYVNGHPAVRATTIRDADDTDPQAAMAAWSISPGQLFVLGDNRGASLDSRFWGTVDVRKVVGRAMLIYWSQGRGWWDIRWDRVGRWLR